MKIFMLRVWYRLVNTFMSLFKDTNTMKRRYELKFWRLLKLKGGFVRHYYAYFYTSHFGLDEEFYKGKKILDIGCGPKGSLEWADVASERVGLDPLAESYRELGTDEHEMQYVAAGAEDIPFPDGYFDVVCSFNSLDHVDDLDDAVKEMIRVLAPGGLFLLLTDVNHKPTKCEPISFSWDVVGKFLPDLKLLDEKEYEKCKRGMYQSITSGVLYDHDNTSRRYGVLSAKFQKV